MKIDLDSLQQRVYMLTVVLELETHDAWNFTQLSSGMSCSAARSESSLSPYGLTFNLLETIVVALLPTNALDIGWNKETEASQFFTGTTHPPSSQTLNSFL